MAKGEWRRREYLEARLKELDKTGTALAQHLGKAPPQISRMLSGELRRMQLDDLEAVAVFLDLPLEKLLEEERAYSGRAPVLPVSSVKRVRSRLADIADDPQLVAARALLSAVMEAEGFVKDVYEEGIAAKVNREVCKELAGIWGVSLKKALKRGKRNQEFVARQVFRQMQAAKKLAFSAGIKSTFDAAQDAESAADC